MCKTQCVDVHIYPWKPFSQCSDAIAKCCSRGSNIIHKQDGFSIEVRRILPDRKDVLRILPTLCSILVRLSAYVLASDKDFRIDRNACLPGYALRYPFRLIITSL